MTLDDSNHMNPCGECGGDCRNPIPKCPDYGTDSLKPGFTMNETKDPAKRLQKLNERRQHLEDTIAQMQDQHFIIESEIAAIVGDEMERNCEIRECPRCQKDCSR